MFQLHWNKHLTSEAKEYAKVYEDGNLVEADNFVARLDIEELKGLGVDEVISAVLLIP